ncbi:hypothetical protein B566_EDAN004884, partial [Ephemera danica]
MVRQKPKKFTIAQERALSMQRSSFLGGILGSHPGDWYHYEPLLHMGIVQIRGPPLAISAITTLQQLLQCKYDNLSDFLEYAKKDPDAFQCNKRLWEHCQNSNNRDWCYEPAFMNAMCQLFPVQSMKVVRVRLELAGLLLNDEDLAVKMVLLVRDPRGTIQSRHHREWCPESPDCDEPELLVIRYEDFSSNPYNQTENLFQFLNLDVHEEVYRYLKSHTKKKSGSEYSTFRNSKTAPFHWREDMDFKVVNKIQNVCADAMELWGYMPAHNASHMHTFNPLRPFYFHRN